MTQMETIIQFEKTYGVEFEKNNDMTEVPEDEELYEWGD